MKLKLNQGSIQLSDHRQNPFICSKHENNNEVKFAYTFITILVVLSARHKYPTQYCKNNMGSSLYLLTSNDANLIAKKSVTCYLNGH